MLMAPHDKRTEEKEDLWTNSISLALCCCSNYQLDDVITQVIWWILTIIVFYSTDETTV